MKIIKTKLVAGCNMPRFDSLYMVSMTSYINTQSRMLSDTILVSAEAVKREIAKRKDRELKLRAEVDLLPAIDVKPLWELQADGSYKLLKAQAISIYKLKYLIKCMDTSHISAKRMRKAILKAVNSGDNDQCVKIFKKLQKLVGTRSEISSLMVVFRRKFSSAISVPYGAADALWTPKEWESILEAENEVSLANHNDNKLLADDMQRAQLSAAQLSIIRDRMTDRANSIRGIRGIVKNFSFSTLDSRQSGVWADASFDLDPDSDKDKIKVLRANYLQNLKGRLIQELQTYDESALVNVTLNDLCSKIEGDLSDLLPEELVEV